MKKRLLSVFIFCLILPAAGQPPQVQTRKIIQEFVEFGQKRIDPYFWLNDATDSLVLRHLHEENLYTDAVLNHTVNLQQKIYNELVARIEQNYESLPVQKNGYWHYIRYQEGKEYPLYCRKKGALSAPEEIFLDVPQLAAGHQIFMVRGYAVSPDNRWLAYGIDTSGDRRCTLHIREIGLAAQSAEKIVNTSGDYVWARDNQTLFYVLNDPTVRAYQVMRHRLGSDPATDVAVYTETDSTFNVYLSATRDQAYLFIASENTLVSEWRYIDGNAAQDPPILIQPRQRDLLYRVEEYEKDAFFIRTNLDARNFTLVTAPIRSPGIKNWRTVIAHRRDALLEEVLIFSQYFVAQYRGNGSTQILVVDRSKNRSEYLPFSEQAYVVNISAATDAGDLDSIRYSYTSLTTPRSDYLYHLGARQKKLLKQEKVGAGYDASLYETRRLWATAGDKTQVPISIVFHKSLFKQKGGQPMLLYAYGSYGASSDPEFDSSVISLLDRGFIYGIAHIRGGQEMGRQWYEEGKLLKKKNTFMDYIACAQYLVDEGYTGADRLFANGASAGGMLMGAITNARPDLFRGVLAEVPWMDVITDSKNTDLPLTTLEYDEWGNPSIKEHYDYMLSWSPYDNVRNARYPAILSTGGLNDTQVPYYSPAKWVARVREHNTGPNPVLLKVNMAAGHSGESGRFESQKLTALKYAFMLDLVGIKE